MTQPYETPINNVTVTDVKHSAPQQLEIDYTRDDLGENPYDTSRGGPVDDHIHRPDAHDPFYAITDAPEPYPA